MRPVAPPRREEPRSRLSRKLASARRVYRTDGMAGVLRILRDWSPLRLLEPGYWRWENWWLGKVVEIRGDRVEIEGATFDVRHPLIRTRSKAWFLFDRYERAEREGVRRFLDPTQPVVELGGSIGVVAVLANRRLHDPTRHVVVEANGALLPLLEANRRRNGAHFTVVHRAVAYDRDEVAFHADGSLSGSIAMSAGDADALRVRTTSLRRVLDDAGFGTCTLICDIEGGEMDLVRQEMDVLVARVAILIMETHPASVGEDATEAMLRALQGVGFTLVSRREATYVFRNGSMAGTAA